MTVERSHGKARPALVRASDLQPTDTTPKPIDSRTADGRFAAGNRAARSARFTHPIREALGSAESAGVALVVVDGGTCELLRLSLVSASRREMGAVSLSVARTRALDRPATGAVAELEARARVKQPALATGGR
jgi:hypothetical protein